MVLGTMVLESMVQDSMALESALPPLAFFDLLALVEPEEGIRLDSCCRLILLGHVLLHPSCYDRLRRTELDDHHSGSECESSELPVELEEPVEMEAVEVEYLTGP